jgi:transcriptional regulator with XRE-family HTH domain
MPRKVSGDLALQQKVKDALKSQNIDQRDLAEQLGIHQSMVSMALNGTNQKTFLRVLNLLEKEYGMDFQESSTPSDIEQIKADLQGLKTQMDHLIKSVAELKGMIKP